MHLKDLAEAAMWGFRSGQRPGECHRAPGTVFRTLYREVRSDPDQAVGAGLLTALESLAGPEARKVAEWRSGLKDLR